MADPLAELATIGTPFSGTTGRSATNNNPLNLEYRPNSYQDQYGAEMEPVSKSGKQRFAKFPNMEAGYNAGLEQIRIDQGRGHTLQSFVNKFAPPHENPTAQIVRDYAKQLGVKADTPLSEIDPEKLIVPMLARESSTRIDKAYKIAATAPKNDPLAELSAIGKSDPLSELESIGVAPAPQPTNEQPPAGAEMEAAAAMGTPIQPPVKPSVMAGMTGVAPGPEQPSTAQQTKEAVMGPDIQPLAPPADPEQLAAMVKKMEMPPSEKLIQSGQALIRPTVNAAEGGGKALSDLIQYGAEKLFGKEEAQKMFGALREGADKWNQEAGAKDYLTPLLAPRKQYAEGEMTTLPAQVVGGIVPYALAGTALPAMASKAIIPAFVRNLITFGAVDVPTGYGEGGTAGALEAAKRVPQTAALFTAAGKVPGVGAYPATGAAFAGSAAMSGERDPRQLAQDFMVGMGVHFFLSPKGIDVVARDSREAKNFQDDISKVYFRIHPEMAGKIGPEEIYQHLTEQDIATITEKVPLAQSLLRRAHTALTEKMAEEQVKVQQETQEAQEKALQDQQAQAEKEAAAQVKEQEKAAQAAEKAKAKPKLRKVKPKAEPEKAVEGTAKGQVAKPEEDVAPPVEAPATPTPTPPTAPEARSGTIEGEARVGAGVESKPAKNKDEITVKGEAKTPLTMTEDEFVEAETRRWGTTPEEERVRFKEIRDKATTPAPEAKPAVGKEPAPAPAQKQAWEMTLAEANESAVKAEQERVGAKYVPGKIGLTTKTGNLSEWGASIKDWHKKEVETALSEGRTVPPEVLADYPDLKPDLQPKPGLGEEGAVSLDMLTKPVMSVIEDTAKLLKDAPEQIRSAGAAIKDNAKKLWEWYKSPFETKERGYRRIVNDYLGESQIAGHENSKYIKAIVKAVPDKVRREGIVNWIQADGDAKVLQEWADKSKGSLKRGYEAALSLTPEEATLAKEVSAKYDYYLQEAQAAGVMENGLENYVNQLWKREKANKAEVKKLQAEINAGLLNTNFKYAKKRIFGSYFEGEQAGYTPANKDIAFLLGHYHQSMYEAISARRAIRSLSNGEAADGRPLVSVSGMGKVIGEKDAPESYLINPKIKPEETGDYRPIDHPALRKWKWVGKDADGKPIYLQGDMLVHPEVYRHLKNVLSKSVVRDYAVGRGALKVSQNLKGVLLSGLPSGFHQTHLGTHAVFHKINPFTTPELNFKDPIQVKGVKNGLMVYNHQALAQFSEGLHSTGLAVKVPGVGRLTQAYGEYLFQDLIPRYKMKLFTEAYERNSERYKGKYTDGQIAEISANQSNAAFGELNYKSMGRNPSMQDMFRLMALAPDFLEARGRFLGQSLRPGGKEQSAAMLRAVIGMYGTGVVANMLLSDDNKPHWNKPFTLVIGKNEYALRSVPGDLIHLLSDPRSFVYHRLNPSVVKPMVEFVTGRDVYGRLRNWKEQLGDYFRGHVPIPAQGLVSQGERTLLQGALQSIGVGSWKHKSDLDKMMSDYYAGQSRLNLSPEQREEMDKRREVLKKAEKGDAEGFEKGLKRLRRKGDLPLTKAQEKRMRERADDAKASMFKGLDIEVALKAYQSGTPEEKNHLADVMEKKINSLWKRDKERYEKLEPEILKIFDAMKEMTNKKPEMPAKPIGKLVPKGQTRQPKEKGFSILDR